MGKTGAPYTLLAGYFDKLFRNNFVFVFLVSLK